MKLPILLAALSVSAAAAPTVPSSYDRSLELRVNSLRSGPGDTIQFLSDGLGDKTEYLTRKLEMWVDARYSVDFAKGDAPRLMEDPLPPLPATTMRRRPGSAAFELVDAAGAVRFKGEHLFADTARHQFSPDNRRFVYLSRRQQLTVVDLETFKSKELGRGEGFWDATDRYVFVNAKSADDLPLAYDFKSGILCETDTRRCRFPPGWSEPALDNWYRPIDPPVQLRKKGELDFELVDRAGAVRYKSSFHKSTSNHSFSHDGRWFVFADRSSNITVVDLASFKARVLDNDAYYHELSGGGRYVQASIKVFDIVTGRKLDIPHEAARSSPDDLWGVVSESRGRGRVLYSIAAGTTTAVLHAKPSLSAGLFSPRSRYLSLQHYPAGCSVYELPSGRVVAETADSCERPAFSPDDRYFVAAAGKENWERLHVWDLRYGAQVSVRLPAARYLFDIKFTGSGRWLAFDVNGTLRAWRVRHGALRRAFVASLLERQSEAAARLKIERDAELAASAAAYASKVDSLRPAKGEFESGAEHAERMKAADEQEALVKREEEGESRRIAAAWDLKTREEGARSKETVESALDEEITETAAVALGAYDADAQEFAATFTIDDERRSARAAVPRKDAPAAKGRTMTAAVVYRHRLENGRPVREDLRVVATDPVLGEVYAWSSTAGTARRAASAPAAPAKLELKAEFADADGDGRLAAGETAKLTVTVTNSGAGAAFGVSASLEPSSVEGLSYASRHFIGEVPPGASRTATIPLKGLAGIGDASRALTVSAADANGFTADPLRVVFETRARRGARLALAEFKIKEAGGDGIVTPGELVEVLLRLRNDGAGPAEAASVKLSGQGSDLFVQGETRRALGALAPGQTAEVRYTVFSNTSLAGDKMRFTAALSEGADSWEAPVEIPLRRALGATRELVVKGRNSPAEAPAEAAAKPAARGAARPDAYAVILGAEDYPKAARVSHARRDAGAFRQFAVGVLGVPDDAAHLFFLDDGVTLAELRKAFSPNGWLARRVGPESDVYVFYAGHGAPSLDGKGAYLVPQDGDPNYAVETGFLVDDMLQALNGSKARSATVWLDACFSGADRESKPLLADARPLMLKADVRVPEGKVALYSAASGAQVSSAYPEKRHGLFTWFSLRGLDGEADANKDGALTAGELADFVLRGVSRTAGSLDREQTPGFRGDRARVLANYRR